MPKVCAAKPSDIIGHIFTKITGMEKDSDEILFHREDGVILKMYHKQDCCESVSVEDVVGYVTDLLDTPILYFDDDTLKSESDKRESFTYTFYNLRTIKGSVTLRWYGTSNGFYSERVDFVVLGK